ncbi:hypothetical protein [Flavobacterium cellulosilyticum]|uniref:hypothetical protein n=1 Tax=Flavobacterium cellulosilyticum TaxID=2541731 RepID=UPI001405101D|nr:hypothetical protein [Flavobacterium cellulosilyticum]
MIKIYVEFLALAFSVLQQGFEWRFIEIPFQTTIDLFVDGVLDNTTLFNCHFFY